MCVSVREIARKGDGARLLVRACVCVYVCVCLIQATTAEVDDEVRSEDKCFFYVCVRVSLCACGCVLRDPMCERCQVGSKTKGGKKHETV